jgi:hypothetical protein
MCISTREASAGRCLAPVKAVRLNDNGQRRMRWSGVSACAMLEMRFKREAHRDGDGTVRMLVRIGLLSFPQRGQAGAAGELSAKNFA